MELEDDDPLHLLLQGLAHHVAEDARLLYRDLPRKHMTETTKTEPNRDAAMKAIGEVATGHSTYHAKVIGDYVGHLEALVDAGKIALSEVTQEVERQRDMKMQHAERASELRTELEDVEADARKQRRYAESLQRVLKWIACYDFNASYCSGWKDAARDFQGWACEAFGAVKATDVPGFSEVDSFLRQHNGLPPTDGLEIVPAEGWAVPGPWIAVTEAMPKAGVPVLAYGLNELGNARRLRAQWCPRWTVESGNEDGEADEYHEETDNYYLREGWYETNEFEETHWKVEFPITHWMALPAPPTVLEKTQLQNEGGGTGTNWITPGHGESPAQHGAATPDKQPEREGSVGNVEKSQHGPESALPHAPPPSSSNCVGIGTVPRDALDAYCAAWIASFSASNPYHSEVKCGPEDRQHIMAGLEAAFQVFPSQGNAPDYKALYEELAAEIRKTFPAQDSSEVKP